MKATIINLWFLGIISGGVLTCGIGESIYFCNLKWLGISGSGLTIITVVCASRKILRLGYKEWKRRRNIINCGHVVPTPEEIKENHQDNLDANASIMAIIIGITGAVSQIIGYLFYK